MGALRFAGCPPEGRRWGWRSGQRRFVILARDDLGDSAVHDVRWAECRAPRTSVRSDHRLGGQGIQMTHDFATTADFRLDTTDGFWSGLSAARQGERAANANFLKGQAEGAFTTTTGWFGTDTSKFGTSHRQEVVFDQPDNNGASTTATAIRSSRHPEQQRDDRNCRADRLDAVDGRVGRGADVADRANGTPATAAARGSRITARCSCS